MVDELQADGEPQGPLGKKQLEQLPSNVQYYRMFDKGSSGCEKGNTWYETMKNRLEKNQDTKKYVDKILKGLCYASSMQGTLSSNNNFCDFFYFWVGDMLPKILDDSSFNAAIELIRTAMESTGDNQKCKFEQRSNHKEYFNKWKKVYDFSVDCGRMEGVLLTSGVLCTEDYYNHLKGAIEAYNAVCRNGTGKDDARCKRIQAVLEGYEEGKELQLNFTPQTETPSSETGTTIYKNVCFGFSTTSTGCLALSVTKEHRDSADGPSSPRRQVPAHSTITQDPILGILPSREVYEEYDTNGMVYVNHNTVPALRSNLKSEVQKYTGVSDCIDEIASVWYYMKEVMPESKSYHGKRCEYFYYWLGDRVGEKLNDAGKFAEAMQKVYEKLPKENGTSECKILYENISKDQFERMKKLYSHSHDYATIIQLLQKNGYRCTEELKKYMEGIYLTYDNVLAACNSSSSDGPHCSGFEQNYGKYCSKESAKLSCGGGISTAAAAAVSSILGIGALPTLAFLSYKYDLLPPWISNYFGGGRNSPRSNRRKGRSGAKSWEPFTDNNSTFDSTTDVSTVASTIDDSTDGSTIYGEPPHRRGRRTGANTNRRQQQPQQQSQPQQQQWPQRTNIKYHPT